MPMKKTNPEPSQSGAMQCIEDDCPECVEDTAIDEARQVKYEDTENYDPIEWMYYGVRKGDNHVPD